MIKSLTLLGLCFALGNCAVNSQKIIPDPVQIQVSPEAININTASLESLERLPQVGSKTAAKIVEHREKFGEFRRPEHLLLVSGITDKRFRKMRHMIKVN